MTGFAQPGGTHLSYLRRPTGRRSAAVASALFTAAVLQTALSGGSAGAAPQPNWWHPWVGTWAASPQQARPADLSNPGNPTVTGFTNQTLREIVHTSVGGTAVRVHISNAYSDHALSVGHATVGVQKSDADLTAAPVPLTFHGKQGVQIPAGGEAVSDPVPMQVPQLTNLAVSIYLPQATGPTTNHAFSDQVNFMSGPGDFAGQTDGQQFTRSAGNWFFLSAVDVRASSPATGSVAAFGDDFTDGFLATPNNNSRWPDFLAGRLEQSGTPMGVVNAGVVGNRLLNGSVCFGQSALERLRKDVLSQSGVRDLILLEGTNDLGFVNLPGAGTGCTAPDPQVTVQQIVDGYQRIIWLAHLRGVKVIGGTLPPFKGSAFYSAGTEQARQAVNSWIRDSHRFDAVIDFDKVLRDPSNPQQLNPAFDAGDQLHLNDDGFKAMADAVDLDQLRF